MFHIILSAVLALLFLLTGVFVLAAVTAVLIARGV
jgi:hypothetical protein